MDIPSNLLLIEEFSIIEYLLQNDIGLYPLIIDSANIFSQYFLKKFQDKVIIESCTIDENTDEEIERAITKGLYLII